MNTFQFLKYKIDQVNQRTNNGIYGTIEILTFLAVVFRMIYVLAWAECKPLSDGTCTYGK